MAELHVNEKSINLSHTDHHVHNSYSLPGLQLVNIKKGTKYTDKNKRINQRNERKTIIIYLTLLHLQLMCRQKQEKHRLYGKPSHHHHQHHRNNCHEHHICNHHQ